MLSGIRRTSVWSILSWALLIISCILCVTDANIALGPSSLSKDIIRSLVHQSAGSPLLTKWLANVIDDRLTKIPEKRLSWLKKIEEDYYENDEQEKASSGAISFNSIKGYIANNKTMVKLNVQGKGFEVSSLNLAYNDEGDDLIDLSTPWTGEPKDFEFEADIFGSETIVLMLTGRIGDFNSSVTAEGIVHFQFEDPGVQMTFVGSESKSSIRIAGNVPASDIPGSVQCSTDNGLACYDLEKDGSYCKMVNIGGDQTIPVCDSSTYMDPLNEIPDEVDLYWMDMPMEMDGMTMDMPMLMATAIFDQRPAKMEVLIYADDDPSKIYSPSDYYCEIQDVNMTGTMCHVMLPDRIPTSQEGVQVLVVGLDENGLVIGSGLQNDIVNEDFTAIIVGACMGAVVGVACLVALIGCYVEKKKKKKLRDIELHSPSKEKY